MPTKYQQFPKAQYELLPNNVKNNSGESFMLMNFKNGFIIFDKAEDRIFTVIEEEDGGKHSNGWMKTKTLCRSPFFTSLSSLCLGSPVPAILNFASGNSSFAQCLVLSGASLCAGAMIIGSALCLSKCLCGRCIEPAQPAQSFYGVPFTEINQKFKDTELKAEYFQPNDLTVNLNGLTSNQNSDLATLLSKIPQLTFSSSIKQPKRANSIEMNLLLEPAITTQSLT